MFTWIFHQGKIIHLLLANMLEPGILAPKSHPLVLRFTNHMFLVCLLCCKPYSLMFLNISLNCLVNYYTILCSFWGFDRNKNSQRHEKQIRTFKDRFKFQYQYQWINLQYNIAFGEGYTLFHCFPQELATKIFTTSSQFTPTIYN